MAHHRTPSRHTTTSTTITHNSNNNNISSSTRPGIIPRHSSIDDPSSNKISSSRIIPADPYFPDNTSSEKNTTTPISDWQSEAAENGHLPHQHHQPTPHRASLSPITDDRPTTSHSQHHHHEPPKPPTPTWTNLPNKPQLAILALSRFVDFFQMAALQTFMVHQLKSFDSNLSEVVISHQAGVLQGAFTAAQIVTSILWGRAADHVMLGRKSVLMIGLVGTGFGCIGLAFSRSYRWAVFWRLMSGAINGTVGSARTMVAEVTPKPWHPRAFLLLPAAFNVANVAGPLLAGYLVDPVVNLAGYFGKNSLLGGAEGILWMERYPYAVANLMSTVLLFAEALLVYYGLQETLKGKRPLDLSEFNPMDILRSLSSQFTQIRTHGYRALHETQRQGLLSGSQVEMDRMTTTGEPLARPPPQRLPFRRIWTSNVLWTLLSIAIFDFHMGAFANLWILFLATPRAYLPESTKAEPLLDNDLRSLHPRGLFKFSSGLGFPPPTIGFAMATIGFIGVALQFLLYPYANARFGLMRCFRGSLFLFPMAYFLAPYLALLPSSTPPPGPASGIPIWMGIAGVVFLQVAARTFALPASIILLNNSSPHPSVLATIHGIGNACSATFRTLGPVLAGYWYGTWTARGIVGMAWWLVGLVAAVGCVASLRVRNGSGHEVFLPGEEGEEKIVDAGGVGRSGDGR
ncbi:unnamed protein product [Zymoseptoria tritici ST99CH_3D1]|nr:unnamed protein product [Zymoseptoria tritici ST99CH_3D1]